MFKPIIHNLEPGSSLFNHCQEYNKMIADKGTKELVTLQEKIDQEKVWKKQCLDKLALISWIANRSHKGALSRGEIDTDGAY